MDSHRRFENYKSESELLCQKIKNLKALYNIGLYLTFICFLLNYLVFLNNSWQKSIDHWMLNFVNCFLIKHINDFLNFKVIRDIFFPIKNFPSDVSPLSVTIAFWVLIFYLQLILDLIYDNKRYLNAKRSTVVTIIYSWGLYIILEWIFEHPLNVEIYAALITAVIIEYSRFNKNFLWRPSFRPVIIGLKCFGLNFFVWPVENIRKNCQKKELLRKYDIKPNNP